MERITLPEFYCPFPAEIHPQAREVHQHTLSWAIHHRLLQEEVAISRFNLSGFAWLAARTYPRTTFEELALTNDFFSWLFMIDDQFDDSSLGRQPERMQQVVDGLLFILRPEGSGQVRPLQSPIAEALEELWARMRARMASAWQQRFADHMRDYLEAYLWETRNRGQGEVPDLAVYIEKRQDAGAMRLALDYIDLTEHVDLPAEVYQSTLIQALLLATNNVVCWQNDLFSIEKEIARGNLSNLVLVLQRAYGGRLQDAVELANDMITREVRLFEQLSKLTGEAFPAYRQDLEKYLVVMRAWMRGNIDWSIDSARYLDVEQFAQGDDPDYIEPILLNPSRSGEQL